MIKVLFVCMGNICRSPMAEAVFRKMVNDAGLEEKIFVDSAGFDSYHEGDLPHRGTMAVLNKHGIPHSGRSRMVKPHDYNEFDYILVMDSHVMSLTKSRQPPGTTPVIKYFLEYAEGVTSLNVPDPWYTGEFDLVYELVQKGCAGLLAALRQEHNL